MPCITFYSRFFKARSRVIYRLKPTFGGQKSNPTFQTWPLAALLAGLLSVFTQQSCESRCEDEPQLVMQWLKQHGGQHAFGLSIEKIKGRGYGMVNRGEKIRRGQVLLNIPWKLVLRQELVESDPRIKMVLEKWRSTDEETYTSQAIRLWLLYHSQQSDSEWSPWLLKLPKDVAAGAEGLPLALCYWGSKDFTGTSLQPAAELQLRKLEKEWSQFKALGDFEAFEEVDWQRFIWAEAILSTRSSSLPYAAGVLSCLVPVLDFLNHDFHPNACIHSRKHGVEVASSKTIEKGQLVSPGRCCFSWGLG